MNVTHLGKRSQRWVLSLLIPAFALSGQPLRANPSGGVVVHGQAVINQVSANHLQINQSSQTAIINWTDFSIGAGQLTQFVQPGVNAAALNRVTGGNVSQIHGMLQGNGSVFVINTNGIVIGASGVVDVGGMTVLSTLDIDNEDFINGGPSRFYGDSQTGVTNFGTISSAQGDVVLLGGFVDNQGQIGALNGTVALGSGGDILLEQNSSGAEITVRGASEYTGTGINNDGQVSGAAVEMKAHGNVYALAINNGNMVRATGATRANGRVRLMASGGSSNINLGQGSNIYAQNGSGGGDVQIASAGGNVTSAGAIDASGSAAGGSVSITGQNVSMAATSTVDVSGVTRGGYAAIDAVGEMDVQGSVTAVGKLDEGGNIEITGDQLIIGENTEIIADGMTEGGRIRVGGEFRGIDGDLREATNTTVGSGARLSADATDGDAGSVVVWANNDTLFRGDVSASAFGSRGDGGLVEVSGKVGLGLSGGSFAATSANGEAGTVLFDPEIVTIGNFGGAGGINQIEYALINDTLQGGSSVLILAEGLGSTIIFEDVNIGPGGDSGSTATNGEFLAVDGSDGLAYNDPNHPRNQSLQWTSDASFGAFAGGNILVDNHIRTSGAGSINLIAGWGGTTSDALVTTGFNNLPTVGGVGPDASTGTGVDVEAAFNGYLASGLFGQNAGFIRVGSESMTRHVEVGSRYGNTNLAASDIFVTASDLNGTHRHAQIGFRDSGTVFGIRNQQTRGTTDLVLDLGGTAFPAGVTDVVAGVILQDEVDINTDGVPDGVALRDQNGDLIPNTFVPYANHYNSARTGNWWWQQIHEASVDTGVGGYTAANVGGNIPEMGAGAATGYANINVVATGDVVLTGGGRDQNSAQIGHGGDSSSFLDDRSRRSGNTETIGGIVYSENWSFNGSFNDRSGSSIARLAPVYGNINVLAGVNAASGVAVNTDGASGATTLDATVNDGGRVILEARQEFFSVNPLNATEIARGDNPLEQNNAQQSPVLIGHGGIGQFGEYNGDITVEADGNVEVRAGAQNRNFAAIGHTIATYHYWKPVSSAAQIRLFDGTAAFNAPEFRRDALGATVEANDGSVISGFHGDISVTANSGDIILKGYDTPTATSNPELGIAPEGLNDYRNNRFARIGHGGSTEEVNQEGIRRLTGGTPPFNGNGNEWIRLRINNTDSASEIDFGNTGTALNRALTFMTITGDIAVDAVTGNVSVISGNGQRDPAQIGHGGTSLADYETSGVIAGDITVNAGGTLDILGGGLNEFTGSSFNSGNSNANSTVGRNYAQVGHGGYSSGFLGFFGDVTVTTGDNITITAGGERDSYAKIGHQGTRDWGQTAGSFDRSENFLFDGISTDIQTVVTSAGVTRTFTDQAGVSGIAGSSTKEISGFTADVSVTSSGGNILLTHEGEVDKENANQEALNLDPGTVNSGFTRTGNVNAQIGHGGINTDSARIQNDSYRFFDKIGDINVEATVGNITLENGRGDQFWTRIGHGLGAAFNDGNGNFTPDAGNFGGNSLILAGDINVFAGGLVDVNAAAADAYGLVENRENGGLLLVGNPSQYNEVNIGHGATLGANGIIVVGDGSTVNGLTATSDITLESNDLQITGGNAYRGSSARVGHGYGDIQGNSNAILRGGTPDGFEGDITVNVANDITITGGTQAWVIEENTSDSLAISVVGAYAAIGNGGYAIDAFSKGDVSVYAGGDVAIVASQRQQTNQTVAGVETDAPRDIEGGSSAVTYAVQNTGNALAEGDNVASVFNFAKIGNFGAENEGAAGTGNRNDAIVNADQTGDTTVIVGGNLTMTGGTTADDDLSPILGAFAQIGLGGPGIGGDMEGDVTVLVGNNLTATGGTLSGISSLGLNNYTMIGNGDRVIRPDQGPSRGGTDADAVFFGEALGIRQGDIVVAVGNNASFTDVLVGHADPLTSTQTATGDTLIAVSRNNPFFGGTGTLTAGSNLTEGYFFQGGTDFFGDTAFSSGGDLEIYMPGRSSNQITQFTRLNSGTSLPNGSADTIARVDFAGLDGSGSATSGETYEVYLTPDLWWDQTGIANASGFTGAGVFPTDLVSGQGGAVASVATPGGFENLTTLTAGALGTSATISSGGPFTFYYDAVEGVLPARVIPPPAPPIIPPVIIPFPFIDFVFQDQFDSYERYQQFLRDGETGSTDGLYTSLTPLEMDDEFASSENSRLENGLDGLFGSSRDNYSEEELNEERRRIRQRLQDGIGAGGGLTFYAFDPGTNQYSSYRVFGVPTEIF